MGKCSESITLQCGSCSSSSYYCKPNKYKKRPCKTKSKYKKTPVNMTSQQVPINSVINSPSISSLFNEIQVQMFLMFIFGFLLFIILIIGMFLLALVFHR